MIIIYVLNLIFFTIFNFYRTMIWISLIVFILIIRIAFAGCFTAASVIITTAVGKSLLGTVNGLSVAFMNVTR